MNLILTIIAVIVIFSVLVLVHEFGHFWAAKKSGVKVLEFGIGFPPRLFSKKHGETVYSVNAIPFGGFVRLFGEDASDPEALKSKRSFATQTPWIRTKIIVAGVFMNLFLAYALLAVGFMFGIQPLILNQDDLFTHLAAGTVEAQSGIFVKKVKDGSEAAKAGIMAGDRLLFADNFAANDVTVVTALEKGEVEKDIDLSFRRGGEMFDVHFVRPEKGDDFGLSFATVTNFPRPAIASVKSGDPFDKAGLKTGDILTKINDAEVYSVSEVTAFLSTGNRFDIAALRGQEEIRLTVDFSKKPGVLIMEVFPESAAQKSGMEAGDFLLRINDAEVNTPHEAQRLIMDTAGNPASYTFKRGEKTFVIETATGENNLLGIALTSVFRIRGEDLSLYNTAVLTSLTKIHDVRYPFFAALQKAFYETGRLTKVTVGAFGRTIKGLFTKLEVPEDIGGPVQIAYYTHTFVQEGFFALLRFTALLSLSLAVINIIPFPALDGGRFLFIVIEVISGRKLNARFETMIHTFGFLLLLFLILLVTFSDFSKIFS